MIRSTPARVMIDTSVATSIGWPWCTRPPTPGVLALGVLAHDHPVEVRRRAALQRRVDAGQDARRPHVGVLVEALADLQPQAPQRDVVRDVRVAGRAEQDRVLVAQRVEAVGRHHHAVLPVVVAAPVEFGELEAQARRRPRASASSTARPAGTTSLPMPSPGISAMRQVFIVVLSQRIRARQCIEARLRSGGRRRARSWRPLTSRLPVRQRQGGSSVASARPDRTCSMKDAPFSGRMKCRYGAGHRNGSGRAGRSVKPISRADSNPSPGKRASDPLARRRLQRREHRRRRRCTRARRWWAAAP